MSSSFATLVFQALNGQWSTINCQWSIILNPVCFYLFTDHRFWLWTIDHGSWTNLVFSVVNFFLAFFFSVFSNVLRYWFFNFSCLIYLCVLCGYFFLCVLCAFAV